MIAEALAGARCVMVVWSRESVASSWVREEADEGLKRGVLIPVLIDDVRPPLGFGRIQAARMIEWDGAPESEPFRTLCADVTAVIGVPSARHAAPEITAPKPPEHGTPAQQRVIAKPGVSGPQRILDHRRTLRLLVTVALVVAAFLAIVTYKSGSRGGDLSQPRPTHVPAEATALRVTAILAEGGEPLAEGVTYEVYTATRDAEGNRKRVTQSGTSFGPPRFPLPAGRYFVTADYGSASANAEVEVTPAAVTLQILNLRAGILRLTAVLAEGGEPLAEGVTYEVYTATRDAEGNRKRVTQSGTSFGPPRFPLPAGRYFVTAARGGGNASAETVITAGGTQGVELRLAPVTKR